MESTNSYVLADVQMSGALKFSGGLLFEGRFEGGLIEGDTLVVGERAQIRADLLVNYLVVAGRVEGDVEVVNRCSLRASAQLHGNLKTGRLSMEDGAIFSGSMQISQPGKPAAA